MTIASLQRRLRKQTRHSVPDDLGAITERLHEFVDPTGSGSAPWWADGADSAKTVILAFLYSPWPFSSGDGGHRRTQAFRFTSEKTSASNGQDIVKKPYSDDENDEVWWFKEDPATPVALLGSPAFLPLSV